MSDENKIRDAADAIKGIAEAVPVYQDALQPALKEVGTGLQTVAKTIHIALAPISGLVWGYEKLSVFIATKLSDKLKNVPPENIITPKANVAGPAFEALRYSGYEESLNDMYANLLASAMDRETARGAHPAFVEILKQMTPDEAKILKGLAGGTLAPMLEIKVKAKNAVQGTGSQTLLNNFSLLGEQAGCECPEMAPSYVDNITRLGLTEIPPNSILTKPGIYDPVEAHPKVERIREDVKSDLPTHTVFLVRKALRLTELGKQFCDVCVMSHDSPKTSSENKPEG
jgi:hypothetical protein